MKNKCPKSGALTHCSDLNAIYREMICPNHDCQQKVKISNRDDFTGKVKIRSHNLPKK